MTAIPEFDSEWGIPLESKWLRSEDFKQAQMRSAIEAVRERTGVDFSEASLMEAISAVGQFEGEEQFDAAVAWLLGVRYPDLAPLPLEAQRQLPLWFWESVLNKVSRQTRFEALRFVSETSFESAVEQWANKPEGVSFGAINFWRKKRADALGQIPDHTFSALYG